MKKFSFFIMFFLLGLMLSLGMAVQASAAVKVRVQPSGATIDAAYALSGESRTLFGNAEGAASGTYEYRWSFSDGGDTAWADVSDPRYISIGHTFGGSGLNWAILAVRDKANTSDAGSATIEVQTLAVDTLNRQKNSAVDRGLRYQYLNEGTGPDGSYWNLGGYPVAGTSMALVAFENHGHNLEALDDDIYKKSVQEGLRWLFNQAYDVALSDQTCIGNPEAEPGKPDGDGDHTGIAFNCWTEGYEVPLAMLAIVNSCEKATAQVLTASSYNPFVNGKTYWDIAIEIKDFLAYAQNDSNGGGGPSFSQSCYLGSGYVSDDYRQLSVWQNGSIYDYGLEVYAYNIEKVVDCANVIARFNYGDGITEDFSPSYCYDGYFYFYTDVYHTYAAPGTYDATVSYSTDGGTTWQDTCVIEIPIAIVVVPECDPNGLGWRYGRNPGSQDNSVSQWPTLALEEARDRWDININPKVIETFKDWLAYSQGGDGGFNYSSPYDGWENFGKTGAGLAMLKWAGFNSSDTNVQNALSFLDVHWTDGGQGGNLNNGDFYAMYAFYKGMKYQHQDTLGGRNWEEVYTQSLINFQNGDGSWYNWEGLSLPSPGMSTSGALAMLAPAVGGLPPVANAGGPYGPVNALQNVLLDGSGSFHQDPSKNLVLYQWDFDASDGLWWDTKSSPAPGEGGTGITVTTSYPVTGVDKTYTVTLRVTDDSVPVQTDMNTATVSVTSGNVPPVALTNGPWAGIPGETIIFDGTSSYDPNACTDPTNPSCLGDSIVSYEWDLNGDGIYNNPDGSDGTPVIPGNYSRVQKAYPDPVSQSITLRVTDSHGLTGMTSPQVNIVSIALVYGQSYNYCFSVRLDRFRLRRGVVVQFQNIGNVEAKNVVMTLTSAPTNVTRVKSTSSLGNMPAGAAALTACDAASTTADIELVFDSRIVPTGQWRWKAEFDIDLGGGILRHYIIDNLPPLAP